MKVIETLQKNQYVLKELSEYSFQSYESIIARYLEFDENDLNLILYKEYNYSKTTGKYLHQFLNEYVNINIWDFIKKNEKQLQKNGYLQFENIKIYYYNESYTIDNEKENE